MIIKYDNYICSYKTCLYFYYYIKNTLKNSSNRLFKIRSNSRYFKIHVIPSSKLTMHR